MPPGSRDEVGATEISALPDDAIRHVFGFLPAEDAVRTSVLAKVWRHYWKSVYSLDTSFRVTCQDCSGSVNYDYRVEWLKSLVDSVLLNGHAPLDECHVHVQGRNPDIGDDRWQIVSYFRLVDIETMFVSKTGLSGQPIFSRHLKRLELCGVHVVDEILDLSCCGALEALRLSYCNIGPVKISSQSVKRLTIANCTFYKSRTCISAPNTISLKLYDNCRATPLLESMPLLQAAFVRLICYYRSCCENWDGEFGGICEDCSANEDHNDGYMLLEGLSSATHLELIAPIAKFTNWRCPTFDKLKTLLLNEWCVVTIDLGALISILQQSPVLEKLTIQLNEGPKKTMLNVESNHTEKSSPISKLLNVVEIKCFNFPYEKNCFKVDQRIYDIVKILRAFDLRVNVIGAWRLAHYFSFEK